MPPNEPRKDSTTRNFDRLAPWYNTVMFPIELLLRRERRRLLSRARGRVLELGIGTGASLPFYPPGCRITGIDPSAQMLTRAHQRAKTARRQVGLVEMDAESLAFRSASFDTVVATLVLCSVNDPIRVLAEARRVMRPEGSLLLLDHVRPVGSLAHIFDRLDPWWSRYSCHLNRQTGNLVTKVGFHCDYERRWMHSMLHAIEATV